MTAETPNPPAIPKVLFPVDEYAGVTVSPHRHRLVPSHLIVLRGRNLRLDLHLTTRQLHALHRQLGEYLA